MAFCYSTISHKVKREELARLSSPSPAEDETTKEKPPVEGAKLMMYLVTYVRVLLEFSRSRENRN